MNASSKPDKLPTAARQPACYRRSAAWRAAVDNSARCHSLRPKRDTACALDRCAAGTATPPSNRYCVTLNRTITMAKTNAQRQSDYRARHLKDLDGQAERLNLLVNLHAKRALERLAACYAVTQREVLEGLLREADRAALERAARVHNGETDYYEKRLRLAKESVTQ
jgi:hypothetical protein